MTFNDFKARAYVKGGINKEIEEYIIGVSKDYCDEINMPIEITMSTIGHWAYC